MTIDVEAEVAGFEAAFRAAGSWARAVAEKRYLKSQLDFHGVDAATIHGAAKAFKRSNRDLTREELIALVETLW